MSKTFKKVSPIRYRQVLETVEKIAIINNEDEKNSILRDIYMIVHPFVGVCDNRHEDWREKQEKIREQLKDF